MRSARELSHSPKPEPRVNFFDWFTLPDEKQWDKILEANTALRRLSLRIRSRPKSLSDLSGFCSSWEYPSWLRLLNNRLSDVRTTYVVARHHFDKGIPDDEWFRSPGRNGLSVEYWPNFKTKHHYIKHFFDYYVDVFYYKVFSALDTLPQLLNAYFQMDVKPGRGAVTKIMKELSHRNETLFQFLDGLQENSTYQTARNIRNDLAHNFPDVDVGPGVTKYATPGGRGVAFGIGRYTTSKELMSNMDGLLSLVAIILKRVSRLLPREGAARMRPSQSPHRAGQNHRPRNHE